MRCGLWHGFLVSDTRQLGRFQREARSAAKLHHTNMVPVFGVGEHDGLHYYVMQFIPGLGLDLVLGELRRLRQPRGKQPPTRGDAPGRPTGAPRDVTAADVARGLLSGEFRHAEPARSVTPHFDSGTSMGRLVLNVLLSFAQLERELIAERTRDKVAAARRKGKWSGGLPCLGYDVDARTKKLVVQEDEATRVRAIFALYLEHRGLIGVVEELARRGWCNKASVTRQGRVRAGRPVLARPPLRRAAAGPPGG